MTSVISFISRKGGTGKTTLLRSLASLSGSALLLDTDPQASLVTWAANRKKRHPDLTGTDCHFVGDPATLRKLVANAKGEFVFIDTPGQHNPDALQLEVKKLSNLVIVPFRTSADFIGSSNNTVRELMAGDGDYRAVVIYRASERKMKAAADKAMEKLGIRRFQTDLRDLSVYGNLSFSGRSPTDLADWRTSGANGELRSLLSEIREIVA